MEDNLIAKYIAELGRKVIFVGKANEQRIEQIEKTLDVQLPESYKRFLQDYGLVLLPGVEIYGNGLADKPSCVKSTMNWREFGLPEEFVVIEDVGEWIYCLDTSRMENYECPVIDWDQIEGIGNEHYESFIEYFKNRLANSLIEEQQFIKKIFVNS